MAMTEDLSAFFSLSEFAHTVIMVGETVSGIFDNGYALGNVGAFGMAGCEPKLTMASADVPPRVVDTYHRWCFEPFDAVDLLITVNGAAYKIVAIEPDGTGVSVLRLESAA